MEGGARLEGIARISGAKNAVLALLRFTLPELEANPALYGRSVTLLDLLGHADAWPLAYLGWELAQLEERGSGWGLGGWAVTGSGDDLGYVWRRRGSGT